ncbi:MAG: putative DNA-binding domain-containing protein [Pseudomonadota bacterium]
MDKLPAFQQYQYAFTAHIRDPKATRRPPGANAQRMGVYSELVYNNIESFLLACFPVLRKVLGSRKWARLVRGFIAGHRSHTPYFRQVPDEFMHFLQNEWQPEEGFPDYLAELAHYEWMELVLSVSNRDERLPSIDAQGDLIEGRPVLNPVLASLTYRYPVHRIRPRVKVEPAPTCLLVFRDAGMQVRFMEHSAAGARLLSLLEDGRSSGREAVMRLAAELGQEDTAQLIGFARNHLEELRSAGAVLGTLTQT